jgi:protein-disulfide isomerase
MAKSSNTFIKGAPKMPDSQTPTRTDSGSKRNLSKRAEVRTKRRQQETRNRIIVIVVIAAVALAIAALVIVTNLPKKIDTASISIPAEMDFPQAEGNAMGNPDAPVKVEEFYDFNCSHCLSYATTQESGIISKFVATGKVYYIDYAYAFMAPTSATAAEAAYCAMEQGKYWEYKKTLFNNASLGNVEAYEDAYLLAYADKLGLDNAAFKKCVSGTQYQDRINENMTYGEGLGVTGTPTFIVNGILVGRDGLEQAILDALGE